MNDTERTISDAILKSAKKKFDYKSLEAVFQETSDDNKAQNVLFKIIDGFASGETKESLATQLTTDMALVGYGFEEHYLEELLAHKEQELRTEILATQFARSMLEQGTHPVTVLNAVHKMLEWPAPRT
jgi:hypothetical protein